MNKTEKLIEIYQKQVDAIPNERPLVVLPCETMLRILKNLEANHQPEEDMNLLIRESLKASKGAADMSFVSTAIMLWKNSKL